MSRADTTEYLLGICEAPGPILSTAKTKQIKIITKDNKTARQKIQSQDEETEMEPRGAHPLFPFPSPPQELVQESNVRAKPHGHQESRLGGGLFLPLLPATVGTITWERELSFFP